MMFADSGTHWGNRVDLEAGVGVQYGARVDEAAVCLWYLVFGNGRSMEP